MWSTRMETQQKKEEKREWKKKKEKDKTSFSFYFSSFSSHLKAIMTSIQYCKIKIAVLNTFFFTRMLALGWLVVLPCIVYITSYNMI